MISCVCSWAKALRAQKLLNLVPGVSTQFALLPHVVSATTRELGIISFSGLL